MSAERPAPPRGIVFDVGGTLLLERSNDLRRGVEAFLDHTVLPPAVADRLGEREDLLADLERLRDATRSTGDREFVMREWLRDELRLPGSDALLAECVIFEACHGLEPAVGAHDLVERLANRGVRLAVVSNTMFGERTLSLALARAGLLDAFGFVITSADHGRRKPAPSIFEAALARLEVKARDAWYVGDSWACDVLGAAAAGMTPIWVSSETAPAAHPRHHRIASLPELAALLDGPA